jgi:hypothetical protein
MKFKDYETKIPEHFKSDGCTLAPDGTWGSCCRIHDYARRDKLVSAATADKMLYSCMRERSNWFMACLYYFWVRVQSISGLSPPALFGVVFMLLFIGGALWASSAKADNLQETRYCGEPERYAAGGGIKRSSAVLKAFRKIHPCPATGLTTGACPGWAIDHVIPLAVGGCDAVSNLQWLPHQIKSSGDDAAKDRWERKVYANPPMQVHLEPSP